MRSSDSITNSMNMKVKVLVFQLCQTLCEPLDCHLPDFSSPRDLPNPGIKHGSPAFQADSLPSEPPGKNSMKLQERVKDKGAWHAVFNGVTKNQTQLNNWTTTTFI